MHEVVVGSVMQFFTVVRSDVRVAQVVVSHFAARVVGRDPVDPYVPVHVVADGLVKQF